MIEGLRRGTHINEYKIQLEQMLVFNKHLSMIEFPLFSALEISHQSALFIARMLVSHMGDYFSGSSLKHFTNHE